MGSKTMENFKSKHGIESDKAVMSVLLNINSALLSSPTQIDSTQLIRCREQVARSLSTHQASLPPNTVFIYQPLHQSLEPCARGAPPCWHSSAPTPLAQTQGRVPHPSPTSASTPIPALLPPPNLRPCPALRLRCKPSAKRKVEEMEVDEFFDGIKRLYNEEAEGGGGGGGEARGCSSLLVPRQVGSSSPCPPLQPVSVP